MESVTDNEDNLLKKNVAFKNVDAPPTFNSELIKNNEDFKEHVESEKGLHTTEMDNAIKCNQGAGTSASLDKVKKTYKNDLGEKMMWKYKCERESASNAANTHGMDNLVYQKRSGSSGVSGQLYETKLLSLVLLRALNDKTIDEFYLGTNISGIGALDDICLRYKSKENNNDVIIFIQAKHRSDADKGKITLNDVQKSSGDFSLAKYFDSYLQIRDKITPKSNDVMFKGDLNDLDCYFIIYTPVKHNITNNGIYFKENNSDTSQKIRSLIETDNQGDIFQLKFDDVDFITHGLIENRVKLLGKIFLDFILNDNRNMMEIELLKRYHIVLAQNVIEISDDVTDGSRKGKFRPDFFNNQEKLIGKFRETLYSEVIKTRPLHRDDDIGLMYFKVCENQTATNISKVIGNHIGYDKKSNRFTLIDKSALSIKEFSYELKDKQVNPSIINDAIRMAGKEILSILEFQLPVWFGNTDIVVKGNSVKVEKRLDFLATELFKLFKNSTNHDDDDIQIIEINDDIVGPNKLIEKGVVEINGGLGSAVGNLLIIDKNTSTLKFNNTEVLPTNAKTLWEKLKNKVSEKDLTRYRFKICLQGFPSVSFADDFYDKKLLEDFVSKLWYYTRQAKETSVEIIAKKEIEKHFEMEMSATPIFRVKTDAIFLKIHDEIQKWWMQTDKICYFTQNTDIFNRAILDIVDNPLITMFNLIYINKMKPLGIEFESHAFKSLNLDTFTSDLLIITTNSNILTGSKMIQHLKGSQNHVFVDFNYIVSFTFHTLESILSEFESVKFETLIISLEMHKNDESIFEKLNYFLNRLNNVKIIIVTNKQLQLELSDDRNITVENDKTSLSDLSPIARDKILNESMVVFQGVEVNLKTIIDDKSEYLITTDTLSKLYNQQVFIIGKSLITSNYDTIEPFYVHRHLSREENNLSYIEDAYSEHSKSRYFDGDDEDTPQIVKSYDINCLKDLKDDIVVVTATPGMGKSTLLTHLSLETKKIYPNTWIARINLLDYSKQFNKWQQNKTVVDEKETIRFLCRATNNLSDSNELELEVINNEIVLIRDNIDTDTLLELDFFFHCYKNGNIIYLFDGFDEICPHYETEVIQLMKTTVNITFTSSVEKKIKQKVWITSRSYNNVKQIIEREFGKSYTLQPLSKVEQRIYLEKFWKKNMNLKHLSYEQFVNIDCFITYYKSSIDNRDTHTVAYIKSISKPLHNIYVAALEYFQNEIKNIPLTEDTEIYRQSWDFDASQPLIIDELIRYKRNVTKALTLSGTPLHMHIAAEHFQNEIKHNLSSDQTNKWDLDMNTFAFYERFLEMKLTKIRFQEKNKIDVCKPDNKIIHDKERKDFMEEHKKLAFYAIFKDYQIFNDLTTEDEIQEIKDIVDSLKFANEKTGVIDCVVDGVPRFVHKMFAEYFAIEYVCDLIKTASSLKCLNRQKIIWQFLFHAVMTDGSVGAFTIFDHKLATNDKLRMFLSNDDTSTTVYDLLSKQTSVDMQEKMRSSWDDEVYHSSYYRTALDIAVENGLSDTAKFLLTFVEKHLNKDNVKYFECLLTENKLIHSAIKQGFDDIIDIILNNLRRVGSSIYKVLMDNDFRYSIFDDISNKTNTEIIADLYSTYNHRIDLKIVSFHAKLLNEICNDLFLRQDFRIPQDFFILLR